MIGRLYPLTDNDPFLSAAEVAKRITRAFPRTLVDDERANQFLLAEEKKLEERGTPSPILQGHRHHFGNTTFIEIRSNTNESVGIRFMVYQDSPIEVLAFPTKLTAEEFGLAKSLLLSIAKELAYDVEFAS